MKKFLKVTGGIVLLILVLLIIIPIFFKERIIEAIQTELSKQIDAEVGFSDVSLSLIRTFPHLNVRLYDFYILGKEPFENLNLVKTDYSSITFNLSSLWKKNSPYEIRNLTFDGLDLNIVVLSDGTANYQIFPEDDSIDETLAPDTSADSDHFALNLRTYEIRNSKIFYDDRGSSTRVRLNNLNHSGSGNFTSDIFSWKTKTQITELFITQAGINYLYALPVNWELDVLADFSTNSFKIERNELLLNQLNLNLEGEINFVNDEDVNLDLILNAPGNDFAELFSALPIAALAGLPEMDLSGDFQFYAEAKGLYSTVSSSYPSFLMRLKVNDGYILYPEMAMPIDRIQVDLDINSPSNDLDDMVINLAELNFILGTNPFQSQLNIQSPLNDPHIVSSINGKLDLGELNKVFPIEGIDHLAGNITTVFNSDLRLSDIENEAWDKLIFNGNINLASVEVLMTDYPQINITSANAVFNERSTSLGKSTLIIGTSDFTIEGELGNILALFSSGQPLQGDILANSSFFDVDEMMNLFSDESLSNENTIKDAYSDTPGFFNVDINSVINAEKILFSPFEISAIEGLLNLKPHLITINEANLIINGSDFSGNLTIENWYEFAMYDERMTIDADVYSGVLDIDKLLFESEDEGGIEVEPTQAIVPDFQYNIHLRARADLVLFSPIEMSSINTTAYVTERDIHIHSFTGNMFGDRLSGDGFVGNYMNYLYLDENLSGELAIKSGSLNLNNWMAAFMEDDQEVSDERVANNIDEMEAIRIPSNVNFGIRGEVNRLQYFDLAFTNVSGNIEIINSALLVNDFSGQVFNGRMGINGLYDSAEEDPLVNMKLEIANFDIPQAFGNMKMLSAIGPLFEYMTGLLNSELIMNTSLGKGMMPIWSSFNAEGFFNTVNANVLNLPILKKAAEQLKFSEIGKLALDNTENWFQVKNGVFELQPTTHKMGSTVMGFSGIHQIGGDMNYLIEASIPKSQIGSTTVGAGLVSGLDFIQSEASKKGINLGDGSHVDVGIQMGGRLIDPTISFSILGVSSGQTISQQVEDVVRDRIQEETEQMRDRVSDELQQRKDDADSLIRSGVDSLREIARKKEEELRKKAEREAEAQIKDLLKDTTIADPVEDIKERVRRFNPFKRGSDDGG